MVTAVSVAREARVTYRQLDYWARKGYLGGLGLHGGSGTPRELTDDQRCQVLLMGRLTRAGFTAEAAAQISRHIVDTNDRTLPLGEGITLTVAPRRF